MLRPSPVLAAAAASQNQRKVASNFDELILTA
jgi:hypothetical protein